MDRLHIEGMAQHKRHPLTGTKVSEPRPGNNALASHDEIIPRRGNSLAKRVWVRWAVAMQQALAMVVQNTDVHGAGMQLNATINWVLFRVASPEVSSSLLGESLPLSAD